MRSQPVNLTYEIELQHGETLTLPPELTASVGAGRWLLTIQPAPAPSSLRLSTRNHSAFLNSYVPEDEGLYDN
jgi:hypothetical protein